MSVDLFIFIILTLFAISFVALPLLFKSNKKRNVDAAIQTQVNNTLFADNLQQLQQQLANGEIGPKTFAKLKAELEAQLELDQRVKTQSDSQFSPNTVRLIFLASALIILALAFIFYQQWGAKPDWEIYQANINKVRQQERGAPEQQVRELNKQLKSLLEARVARRDDNLRNYFLLARTYYELGDYQSSVETFEKILEIEPQAVQVISELAQVKFLADGQRFTEEVKALFDRAIALSPQDIRTLSYAGMSAYQGRDFQSALGYWQQAVALSQPGSEQHKYMQQALDATKNQLRAAGIEPEQGAPAAVAVAADSPQLTVNVSLGPELELNPNYRVFVYAKAWEGPPMPLAVRDVKVSDLPLTITLNESMNPGMPMKLSQFSEWELVARVSQSGTANAKSGDWQASLGPVTEDNADETFQLVITSQIP